MLADKVRLVPAVVAAWLLALVLGMPADAREAAEEPAPPACEPCEELVALVGTRHQSANGSHEFGLPSLETLGTVTVEIAEQASPLAKGCWDSVEPYHSDAAENTLVCGLATKDVYDFTGELQRLTKQFKDATLYRYHLSKAMARLRKHSKAPINKDQLPPGSLCADCSTLLASLEEVLNQAAGARDLSETEIDRADLAEAALKEFKSLISDLCRHRQAFLGFDWDYMQKEHLYFTWTETWGTIEAMRRELTGSTFDNLCK